MGCGCNGSTTEITVPREEVEVPESEQRVENLSDATKYVLPPMETPKPVKEQFGEKCPMIKG